MKSFYRIVVPTTIFDQVAPTVIVRKVLTEVKSKLASHFGGYTEYAAIGGYVADDGKLIEEQVYIVEAYCEAENDDLIEELARMVKTELRQESVMVTKNGEVTFL